MEPTPRRSTHAFWKGKKVLVTGGNGFLGKHLVKKLKERGVSDGQIMIPASACDLRRFDNARSVLRGSDIIIHAAGLVGGSGFAQKHPARMFYDNVAMAINILEAARQEGVEKFVGIGSACEYPAVPTIPFREDDLWSGYPEEIMASYGIAKRMMLVQSQAYRAEYGLNAIHLLQANLYGPGDNFDPEHSHVIAALIDKIAQAKEKCLNDIEVWGTGKATREFLYVEDAAEGVVLAAEKYDSPDPMNLGNGLEIAIKDLVALIVKLMNFHGRISWNPLKPEGQSRRVLDVTRAKNEFGFEAKTSLETGLKKTIDWYHYHIENP